jgi:hypothetical protein
MQEYESWHRREYDHKRRCDDSPAERRKVGSKQHQFDQYSGFHALHELRYSIFADPFVVVLPDLIKTNHFLRRIDDRAHIDLTLR